MTTLRKASEASNDGLICTYSGMWIKPLEPDPSLIRIKDIAHSLANQCRFTGHVKEFYSVAQHSVLASYLVDDEFMLETLLHDASEAYLSDIARPVKNTPTFGQQYRAVEAVLEEAIAAHFDLPWPMSPEVKVADNLMLWAEIRDLMPSHPPDGVEMYQEEITPWLPKDAEAKFLSRYFELTSEANLRSVVGASK
jgi:uncharacterized protein